MSVKHDSVFISGLLCYILILCIDCVAHSIRHHHERSIDDITSSTHKTRPYKADNQSSTSGTLVNDVITQRTTTPSWLENLLIGKWYGSESYMKRELYLKAPYKRPTICFNNETADSNGTIFNNFICPTSDQKDTYKFCCGPRHKQHCCTLEQSKEEDEEETLLLNDLDIVTGISIAVGFFLSVTVCLSLYCCCCQRRPEIHDGIKLMWVRRSFGKELNRIEQPMYQNHLTVAGGSHLPSRGGSRNASRGGSLNPSRSGSRNASRNASRECSPSVSRRGSHNASTRRKDDDSKTKPKVPGGGVTITLTTPSDKQDDDSKTKLKVPVGGVTITLTTPSDEQGPTNPLLKQTKEHIEVPEYAKMQFHMMTSLKHINDVK